MKEKKIKIKIKKIIPLESWEQEQFFRWVYSNQIRWPELQLINGSMNGIRLSIGLRSKAKRQGLRAGFPDIDIPIRRGNCSGLKIELKRVEKGKVSEIQETIHRKLIDQGYSVRVCYGFQHAIHCVMKYLDLYE